MISSVPSPKPGEGDTFHFPEIMLNVITSPPYGGYTTRGAVRGST